MIKRKIKVRCIQEFTEYNTKQIEGFEVLAEVFEGNEYEAELYKKTNEYFARDHKDREFLVGELKMNSLGESKIKLGKEFELIKDKDKNISNEKKEKTL
jgi:hypothetical protein